MGNTHPKPLTVPDDTPVFQVFRSTNKALVRLRTNICADTGKRHIAWDIIQHEFEGIDYLTDDQDQRCLFMIGKDGEVYVLLFHCAPSDD